MGDLEKSKYYNDRICRGKFESNQSIVKKMSQNHIDKISNHEITESKGLLLGTITNIEKTINRLWMKHE